MVSSRLWVAASAATAPSFNAALDIEKKLDRSVAIVSNYYHFVPLMLFKVIAYFLCQGGAVA